LVGNLDALVDGGKRTHGASIIGRMSKARRLGLVLLLNLLLVAALVIVGDLTFITAAGSGDLAVTCGFSWILVRICALAGGRKVPAWRMCAR
jgi:hypothetical protein